MKNLLRFSVAAFILAAAFVTSCDKEEDPVPTNVDKTELHGAL